MICDKTDGQASINMYQKLAQKEEGKRQIEAVLILPLKKKKRKEETLYFNLKAFCPAGSVLMLPALLWPAQ